MNDKERDANELVEEILRQLRQQQESGLSAAKPAQPDLAKEPAPQPQQAPAQAQPLAEPKDHQAPQPENQPAEPETVEHIAPAVEEIFPEAPLPARSIASADELIDDRFREFFTTSVALDRSQFPAKEEKKKKGFFSRLFARPADEEDEDEDYEDLVEDDAYLEDDEDDAEDLRQNSRPALPKDLFSQGKSEPVAAAAPGTAGQSAAVQLDTPQPEREVLAGGQMSNGTVCGQQEQGFAEKLPQNEENESDEDAKVYEQKAPGKAEDVLGQAEPNQTADLAELAELAQPGEPAQMAQLAQKAQIVDLFEQQDASGDVPVEERPTREHEWKGKLHRHTQEQKEEEEEQEEEEPIRDYESPQDAAAVEDDLKSLKASLTFRLILSGLISVFLFYITLTKSSSSLPTLEILSPTAQPLVYLLVCLVLLGLCAAVNWPTVWGGLSSVKGAPNPDIAPALAVVFTLVQTIVFLVNAEAFGQGSYVPFCSLAAVALTANTLGKLLTVQVVLDNFKLASTGFDHAAAFCLQDDKLAKKVTAGLGESEPKVLVSRPTALVKGFLKQSFSEHPTDKSARWLGILAAAAGLCSGVAVAVTTGSGLSAISCAACAVCLATPLASTLVGALPTALMQSSAARVGAVIPGPSAVQELCGTNVLLIQARDLFPTGTVTLRGIKTFQKERIDLAILYAASILVEGCETMRDVFLGVVEGKREMLYKVENLTCETGRGFVGWIEGNRIIVGNRAIMQAHDIDIPSMDYERKYTGDEKQPVYLAVSGRLFGMFLVSYKPAEEMRSAVEELRAAGLSLLVRSTDFCVNEKLICDCYDIPRDSVKVLNEAELNALEPNLEYLPTSEGLMTHIGSFSSYVGGLHAAQAAGAAEHTAGLVEVASVVLALVLTLLLTFTAGLGRLSVLAILLYQLAWLILTLAAPLLKKY